MQIIPLVGMLSSFSMVIIIIVVVFLYDYKKRQLQSREIMAAIEKGIEVPFPPPKKRNYLHLGLIWTLVGVAFTLALWFSARVMEAAAWGFLPIGLGLAFLLIAYLQRKNKADEGENA